MLIRLNSQHIVGINLFLIKNREGIVEQVKVPTEIQFHSFKDTLVNPVPPDMKNHGMYLCDWEKIGYPE